MTLDMMQHVSSTSLIPNLRIPQLISGVGASLAQSSRIVLGLIDSTYPTTCYTTACTQNRSLLIHSQPGGYTFREDTTSCGRICRCISWSLHGKECDIKRLKFLQSANSDERDNAKKGILPIHSTFHSTYYPLLPTQEFYRESLLWQDLNHRNILPFLGIFEGRLDNASYMVLPLF